MNAEWPHEIIFEPREESDDIVSYRRRRLQRLLVLGMPDYLIEEDCRLLLAAISGNKPHAILRWMRSAFRDWIHRLAADFQLWSHPHLHWKDESGVCWICEFEEGEEE